MLEHATVIPRLPDDYDKVNRYISFKSLDLGKAYKEVRKSFDKDPEDEHLAKAMQDLQRIVAVDMGRCDRMIENRDYGAAHELLNLMCDKWAGSLPADEARVYRVEMLRNSDAKKDVKAYKTFLKGEEMRTIRKYDKARPYYEKVIRNFAGTKSAERSERILKQLPNE